MERSELKYCQNWELRRTICFLSGIDAADCNRYSPENNRALSKPHLYVVAETLGEPPEELTLEELYRWVCDECGVEYNENAGNQWKLGRKQLKEIFRSISLSKNDTS